MRISQQLHPLQSISALSAKGKSLVHSQLKELKAETLPHEQLTYTDFKSILSEEKLATRQLPHEQTCMILARKLVEGQDQDKNQDSSNH